MFSKIFHGSLAQALVWFVFLLGVGENSKFAVLECLMVSLPPAIKGKDSRVITGC